jgi:hypothetical protein
MIELTIPEAGEETKNAKDLIFSVLSTKQPLSGIEIFNIIRKKHNAGLTYQAVMKAINSLVKNNVIIKEKKNYSINKDWLVEVKILVDKLLTTHTSQQQVKIFNEEMAHQDYAVYTFSNLLDLDNFWDDMLIHITDNLKKDEDHSFIAHAHYGWWLLINLGKEIKVFKHMMKNRLTCYNLFIGKYPLNIWAKKIYKDIGVIFKVIEDNTIEESITLNVIGDTIIQVNYPKEILVKLKKFYEKYKTTQEMSLSEISELANEQCEIKLIIFKNREIAQSLRDKYIKKFN